MSQVAHDADFRGRARSNGVPASRALLGALMQNHEAWQRILEFNIDDAMFEDPNERAIFQCIEQLLIKGENTDSVSVFLALQQSGYQVEMALVSAIESCVPSAAGIVRYAQTVVQEASRRSLLEAVRRAQEIAQSGKDVVEDLDQIYGLLARVQTGSKSDAPVKLRDLTIDRIDRLQSVLDGTLVEEVWPTGIPDLDRALNGGIRPGILTCLAARPSVGKSSLAQTIGLNNARDGRAVGFLSQEMPKREVADRALATLGPVDYGVMQRGNREEFEDENRFDWSALTDAVDIAGKLGFFIDDQAGLTLMDIRRKAYQLKRHGVRIVILDYLQLCATPGRENRSKEIGDISRGLKQLAKELDMAFLVLSQLNREVEKRASKEPIMSDLRESGDIEQDADVILFLWAEEDEADESTGTRLIGAKLSKNRQGRLVRFGLDFQGRYQRWIPSPRAVGDAAASSGLGGGRRPRSLMAQN